MATNRRELEGAIAARAMSSPSFRAALLADPRKAILSEFNVAIPDGITFTVHEESPHNIHIVIPAPAAQLSEHQLDTVAGGMHISHVTGGSGGSSSPTTPSPSGPLPLPWPKWF